MPLRRFVLEHRRLLAAVCAGLATLLAISAARDTGDGVEVVVAADDLASGRLLTERDVEVRTVPADLVADHALSGLEATVGQRVAGPVRRGETLTDARLLRPVELGGDPGDDPGDETVLSTVRLPDAAARQGLQVGDRVDVVALDPQTGRAADAETVAEGVRVAALPESDEAATVVLVTDRETAVSLAAAALRSALSVIARLPGEA